MTEKVKPGRPETVEDKLSEEVFDRVSYIREELFITDKEFRDAFKGTVSCGRKKFFSEGRKKGLKKSVGIELSRHMGIPSYLFSTKVPKEIEEFKDYVKQFEKESNGDYSTPMSKPLTLDGKAPHKPENFDLENKDYRKEIKFYDYEDFKNEAKHIFDIISFENVERNVSLFRDHKYIEYDFYRSIANMINEYCDCPVDLKGNQFHVFRDSDEPELFMSATMKGYDIAFPPELEESMENSLDAVSEEIIRELSGSMFHCWHRSLLMLYNFIEEHQIEPEGEEDDFRISFSKIRRQKLRKQVSALIKKIELINYILIQIMSLSPEDAEKVLFPQPDKEKEDLKDCLFDIKRELEDKYGEMKRLEHDIKEREAVKSREHDADEWEALKNARLENTFILKRRYMKLERMKKDIEQMKKEMQEMEDVLKAKECPLLDGSNVMYLLWAYDHSSSFLQ